METRLNCSSYSTGEFCSHYCQVRQNLLSVLFIMNHGNDDENSKRDGLIKPSIVSIPMTFIEQVNQTTASFQQCLTEKLRSNEK